MGKIFLYTLDELHMQNTAACVFTGKKSRTFLANKQYL